MSMREATLRQVTTDLGLTILVDWIQKKREAAEKQKEKKTRRKYFFFVDQT